MNFDVRINFYFSKKNLLMELYFILLNKTLKLIKQFKFSFVIIKIPFSNQKKIILN